jgi:hypothetical protein
LSKGYPAYYRVPYPLGRNSIDKILDENENIKGINTQPQQHFNKIVDQKAYLFQIVARLLFGKEE